MLSRLVAKGNGIELSAGARGTILLDPDRDGVNGVVSHAHSDHVPRRRRKNADDTPRGPAVMTAPTLDLLRISRPDVHAHAIGYDEPVEVAGAEVVLRDAGHVVGSAMVRADLDGIRFLYTGDFTPVAGFTTGAADPEPVDVLITESTYGEPRFDMPPRGLVLDNLERWVLRHMWHGSVALGSYQLGRAQELIAWLNHMGVTPVVSPDIGRVASIYNAHGHDLSYAVLGSSKAQELAGNCCYVVPKRHLKMDHPFVQRLRHENGKAAYLSGWAQVYNYFEAYAIDAQFPLTDHATFPELLDFVERTGAKEVVTVHGRPQALAREIEKRLGVPARALGKR